MNKKTSKSVKNFKLWPIFNSKFLIWTTVQCVVIAIANIKSSLLKIKCRSIVRGNKQYAEMGTDGYL